jgi:hypothetical protein
MRAMREGLRPGMRRLVPGNDVMIECSFHG